MKSPIIIIGIGEIGSVLARGFLRTGYPVYPVTRETNIEELSEIIQNPEAVVVAVGETELQNVLQSFPEHWKSQLILIQNELLPRDWEKHDLNPTVISVWFEKKKGHDVKVVVPSPIFGEKAELLSKALASLDIPTTILDSEEQLLFELVRKNYYILTSNIAGLETRGTVSDLWENHNSLARKVIDDVHQIQQSLVKPQLSKTDLTKAMVIAFEGDPHHGCMGRSAPARLQRAIEIADKNNLNVPTLKQIMANQS